MCPNGITATPVIDKRSNTLYVIAGNGSLYGLDLGSRKVHYGPVQFVAPFSKNWSLNLFDGAVYTVLSPGCGRSRPFYSIEIGDSHRPLIRQMLLSNTDTAGVWAEVKPSLATWTHVWLDGSTAARSAGRDYSNSIVSTSLSDNARAVYALSWLRPSSGARRALLEERRFATHPSFAPDGLRLAFFARAGKTEQILVVGVDGSGKRWVTSDPGQASAVPDWSADGRWIYFYRVAPRPAFLRVPAAGGREEVVAADFRSTRTSVRRSTRPAGGWSIR